MDEATKKFYTLAFANAIHDKATETDPSNEQDWYSLTLGWAIGKGFTPDDAHDFARYIRYETEWGQIVKYKVHIYAVVRVPVEVEADSQLEAIKKADQIDLHEIIDHNIRYTEVEFAEEITGFLVDEIGDEKYEKTKYYDFDTVAEKLYK